MPVVIVAGYSLDSKDSLTLDEELESQAVPQERSPRSSNATELSFDHTTILKKLLRLEGWKVSSLEETPEYNKLHLTVRLGFYLHSYKVVNSAKYHAA
ncbi:hypothetical protein RRG08_054991 [Elysia crispata]|uniref:Uncharacterized protein n=1 Tax=Elysia crispata TaxID=231223 RepID=A0AAE0XRV5_9GAST|nr:hypothetical protein RRG08_054991 [Elysia crispata]